MSASRTMDTEHNQPEAAAAPAGGAEAASAAPTAATPVRYAVQIGLLGRRFPFAASQPLDEHYGRAVIVEADYGLDLGILRGREESGGRDVAGTVVRLADANDLAQMKRNQETNAECRREFEQAVAEEGLQMKLVGIDHSCERTKITFYYHAEGRVVFRQLVKVLASRLRRRIELYHLNLRDQFLFHPFIGPCGRELCCRLRPELFSEKIPTRLAKVQKLSYNPQKMSGVCGKPRCCLKYEVESYQEFADFLGLKSGRPFRRKDGDPREFRVVDWNMVTNEVFVQVGEEEAELVFGFAEFRRDFEPVKRAK